MRKFAAALFLLALVSHARAASIDKAEILRDKGDFSAARKQYESVIRKGSGLDREEATLGLMWTYFQEKDFRGVLRSGDPILNKIPENKNGAWMHLLQYRSARILGEHDRAARHYQAIVRSRADFSFSEIADHLRMLASLDALKKSAVPADTSTTDIRQKNYLLAESLMTLDIVRGARRMWIILATDRPDEIGRNALLRLGQSLDWDGEWEEAGRYLKLFVLLFPEDSGSADALYRISKWAAPSSSASPNPYFLAGEFYPATLYGAMSVIDQAHTWPTRERIASVFKILSDAPGLPDSILDQGFSLLIHHADWAASDAEREWIARRYLTIFPGGPDSPDAQKLLKRQ